MRPRPAAAPRPQGAKPAAGPRRPAAGSVVLGHSLADLAELKSAWRQQREAQATQAQAARRAEAMASVAAQRPPAAAGQATAQRSSPPSACGPAVAEAQALSDHELFVRSVGTVQPLKDAGRWHWSPPSPPPLPRQRQADERAALAASLSDEVSPESLLLTDDGLSFRRHGIGQEVVVRLRRGHWALQAEVDLHGLTREQAREALLRFVRQAHARGLRCLRVVHGKGLGSPGREAVLRPKVQRWLAQCQEVLAFAQASGPMGGAGALMVLLV